MGLLLDRITNNCLIEFEPINGRILRARFQTKYFKLIIIQIYAPAEDHNEESKESYYEQLQCICQKIPKYDLLIVMGDFNAKIRNDNKGYEDILGIHGIGVLNDNGQRLIDFCQLNDLVIGGSLFQHKDIHKTTWTASNGLIKNQIDHFCIKRKFRRSLLDVRAYRGADINSDHQLCIVKMEIKLKSTARRSPAPINKVNIERLESSEISNKFTVELRNNLSATQPESNIETEWANIKTAYIECARKILGYRKHNHKQWISETTWNKIEQRKQVKLNILHAKTSIEKKELNRTYKASDKEVKSLARHDKRQYLKNVAEADEKAAQKNDLRELYRITGSLSGNFKTPTDLPIQAKNGKTLTSQKDISNRWVEHFKELLNRPAATEKFTFEHITPTEDPNIDLGLITKTEIITVIKTIKNDKASGLDGISGELLKLKEPASINRLVHLYNNI